MLKYVGLDVLQFGCFLCAWIPAIALGFPVAAIVIAATFIGFGWGKMHGFRKGVRWAGQELAGRDALKLLDLLENHVDLPPDDPRRRAFAEVRGKIRHNAGRQ